MRRRLRRIDALRFSDRTGSLNLSVGPRHGRNPNRVPGQAHTGRVLLSLKMAKSSLGL